MSNIINCRENPFLEISPYVEKWRFSLNFFKAPYYMTTDLIEKLAIVFAQNNWGTLEYYKRPVLANRFSNYSDFIYNSYADSIKTISKSYAAKYPHWEQFPPELIQQLTFLEERAYNYFQFCVESMARRENEQWFGGEVVAILRRKVELPLNLDDYRAANGFKSPPNYEQAEQFFTRLIAQYNSVLEGDFRAAEQAYQAQERLASFDNGVDITDEGIVTGVPFDFLYTDPALGRVCREFNRSVRDTLDYYSISLSPVYRAMEAYWAFVQDFYVFKALYAFRMGVWHVYPILAFVLEGALVVFLLLFFFRHTFGLLRLETWYYKFLIKNNLTLLFLPGVLANQVFVFLRRWWIRSKLFIQKVIAKLRPIYKNRRVYTKRIYGWLVDRRDRVIAICYETKSNFLENLAKADTKAEEAMERWVYKSVLDALQQKQNRAKEKTRELGSYHNKLYTYLNSKDPENYPSLPTIQISGKPLQQKVPKRSPSPGFQYKQYKR